MQQEALREPFDRLQRELQRQTLIAVMRDTLRRFDQETYPELLYKMTSWATPKADGEEGKDGAKGMGETEVVYVTKASLPVPFRKPWLADEQDVEEYLKALSQALLKAIHDGKRVNV